MGKEISTCGDIETEILDIEILKYIFYCHKSLAL